MTDEAPGLPPAEVEIDLEMIRSLIMSQLPDLKDLPTQLAGEGWDNMMIRIGDAHALRMPRHAHGEQLLKNEQDWLPQLAPILPLPVPEPVFIGTPGFGYPFTWSLVRWLPGDVAALSPPMPSEAGTLAAFLRALHVAAPQGAPKNDARGCPLIHKQEDTERRMANISHRTDLLTPKLRDLWHRALAAPIDVSPLWLAGDIHPQNVLVEKGRFSAFIDWGDMCTGDCASDLASIWMLFEDMAARARVIEAYGMSEATLLRAKGWAIFYGVILLETGLRDDPLHAKTGEATLRRLNADA